ncbi:hypothetical protein [Saccharopolyspora pogona]|nr:hypothetical protein [Saccharopolyspora pogona]
MLARSPVMFWSFAAVDLRQMGILRARVPEAAIHEHGDPRPAEQDISRR